MVGKIIRILLSLFAKSRPDLPTDMGAGRSSAVNMESPMDMSCNTVLIVDDEPLIRMSLAAAFEDEGFVVVEARNVLEAVAVLARRPVAALVTDVDMPGGLNGLDLVDLVAATSRFTTIVVVSGRDLPVDYDLPASAVFHSKPYNHLQIIAEVRGEIGIYRRTNASCV
jgi:two-component system, response regulator PdtaR